MTLGDLDWTEEGEWPRMSVGVRELVMHPGFRKGALFNNDFAILKLDQPLDFAAHDWIRPACLPDLSYGLGNHVGEEARVTGWGWTNPDYSSQAGHLQSVKVDIMSNEECVSEYSTKVRNCLEKTQHSSSTIFALSFWLRSSSCSLISPSESCFIHFS